MSNGMCCSEKEIGISDDNSGIMEITDDIPNGTDLKDVYADRFLIFENCDKSENGTKDIYVENADGSFKHILSVMDLKKMIPIKIGLYSEVDLNPSENDSLAEKKYKVLLNLEYSFCLKIIDSIIQKATKLYNKQIQTKKVIKFCCDFKLLEEKCREYKA